ncbi:hypothetical protein sos41_11730 [Alphaproteobacteria bacterium SO-S41]|nr:hypothetical protein sos41_11730 [Alphaproteobacteria bacterium SO-S41]
MTQPVRLRLSRARGFDLQSHSRAVNGLPAIAVVRPSLLGNPFVVGVDGNRAECVFLEAAVLGGYTALGKSASVEAQIAHRNHVAAVRESYRMHNVACWCVLPIAKQDDVCHAVTLIDVFNAPPRLTKFIGPTSPATDDGRVS